MNCSKRNQKRRSIYYKQLLIITNSSNSMILGLIFLLLQFHSAESAQRTLGIDDNVYCGVPRASVVPVEPKYYKYFPYYVMLHRCEGSWHTLRPTNRICTATKWQKIKTEVYSQFTREMLSIYLKNHTECGYECVKKPSECNTALQYYDEDKCTCGCKYPTPKGPPTPCEKGFRWSPVNCKCLCNKPPIFCPRRQEWSSDLCGCTCTEDVVKLCASKKQGLNHNTCSCVDVEALSRNSEGCVNARMYITLLVLQSFVIVMLVCALVHWIRKKRRPRIKLACKYSKASIRDSMDMLNSDSTGTKECSDAGSVAIQTEGIERLSSNGSDTLDSLNRETDL